MNISAARSIKKVYLMMGIIFIVFLALQIHNDSLIINYADKEITVTANACIPTTGSIDSGVFGIHTWGPYHTHPSSLAAIDDLGVRWIYAGVHWPSIAPQAHELMIRDVYDQFFLEMAARDINLLVSLGNYWPPWIRSVEELEIEMYKMVQAVVSRYKPGGSFAHEYGLGDFGVRYWEIINEPNFPCCGWGAHDANQPVDAQLYASLLVNANRAIRTTDPAAVILFGGLSSGHTYYDPERFLGEVYDYGAKDCFDVLAYHPYDDVYDFEGAVDDLRSVMSLVGDGGKPIWFTELGEPSLASAENEKLSQIDVFKQSIEQIDAVPAFFWFSLHDFSETETWGVLDGDLKPREPIYSEVKAHLNDVDRSE